MKKIYGNVDLNALQGTTIEQNAEGEEVIQIPIDRAKLRRVKNHLYLPIFIFEKKIYTYDYVITRSQTKEERENRQRTEVLGNAVNVNSFNTEEHTKPDRNRPPQPPMAYEEPDEAY